MFSFLKLIDGVSIVGYVIDETDECIFIENAVEMGDRRKDIIERHYFFRGMYCPFTNDFPILTQIYKDHVISYHENLDDYLETQYKKFVNTWHTAKHKTPELQPTSEVTNEELETLRAMLEFQGLANNEIH